jgi:dihydroflavonol-4-reductase
LVHFSSIHVFDPFPLDQSLDESRALVGVNASAYSQSKVLGEKIVMEAVAGGLNAVIITPTSIFGPNDHFPSLLGQAIIDIYNGNIPALVPGGYDFVDVRDIVKGTINAIDRGVSGEKYILSGTYLSIKELAKKIGLIGGVTAVQRVLPTWLLKALIPVFKLQSKLNHKPPLFTNESLKVLTESNPYVSSEKAKRELGYSVTPVDKSIKDTLAWFGENGFLG